MSAVSDQDVMMGCAVQPSLEDLDDKVVSKILQLGDYRIHGVASSCSRFQRLARQLGSAHLRLSANDGLLLPSLPPRRRFPSVRKLTVTLTADSPMALPAATAGLLYVAKTYPGVENIKVAMKGARGQIVDGEHQLTAQEEWWNKLLRTTTPLDQLLSLSCFMSLTKLKLSVGMLTGHATAPLAALTGLTKMTLSADESELGSVSRTPLTQLTALQQLQRLVLVGVPAPDRALPPMADAQAAEAAAAAVDQGQQQEGAAAGGNLLQEGAWFPPSLTNLYLFNTPNPGVWVGAAAASCSNLEALDIDWDCRDGDAEFDFRDHPSCIMRDYGHCFPKLRALRLTKYFGEAPFSSWDEEEEEEVTLNVASTYGIDIMSAYMLKALPSDFIVVTQLTHLTSLTELRVSGWRMRVTSDDEWQRLGAIRHLVQLAGLAAEVPPPAGLTWPHLTQLWGRMMWAGADWRLLLLACPALRWLWVKTSHQRLWKQGAEAPAYNPAVAHLHHTNLRRLDVDHQHSEMPLQENVAAAVNRLAGVAPNIMVLDLKSGPSQGGLPDFWRLRKLHWLALRAEGPAIPREDLQAALTPLRQLRGLELGVNYAPADRSVRLLVELVGPGGTATPGLPLEVFCRDGTRPRTNASWPLAVWVPVQFRKCRFLCDHPDTYEERNSWRDKYTQLE